MRDSFFETVRPCLITESETDSGKNSQLSYEDKTNLKLFKLIHHNIYLMTQILKVTSYILKHT